MMGFLGRSKEIFLSYPVPDKTDNVIQFGILGAAKIAPFAIITPAKQHAEVTIRAVAARNATKAAAFARKHGIPHSYGSYQELLDDKAIDAVYIPLPNGLHYEWTLRAIAAGKHVLLEKPSVSNATEAEALFGSPLLRPGPTAGPGSGVSTPPPVLLEAFHYRFQPAWLLFESLLDRPNIAHASVRMLGPPAVITPADDIRFQYDLAGGALMDLAYTCHTLRTALGAEPEACAACTCRTLPPPHELCDVAFRATWRFPGGVTAKMVGNLQPTVRETITQAPRIEVVHRPVVMPSEPGDGEGVQRVRTRKVVLVNYLVSNLWHRIDVEDSWELVRKGSGSGGSEGAGKTGGERVVRRWKTKESRKAYTLAEAGINRPSERYWLSYRYQLEEFVHRVRGRPGSGAWNGFEDSIAQMRMVDMAYAKAGLPLRPTSGFQLETSRASPEAE